MIFEGKSAVQLRCVVELHTSNIWKFQNDFLEYLMVLLVSLRYQLFQFYRWGVEAHEVTCSCSYEVSQSLKFILIPLQPLLEPNHLDFSSLKTEAPWTSFKLCLNPAVRHAVRNNIAFGFLFLHNFMALGTEGLQRGDCISWFLVKFSRGLEAAWTVLPSCAPKMK